MRKKITRWLVYTVLMILALLIVLYFAVQTTSVQNYAKDKILSNLSERYNAEWSIGDIKIDFFDEVIAKDILFLDQQKDTLLAADALMIDISLFSLLGKEINIDEIQIQGVRTNIYELDEGKMNFDFLLPEQEEFNGVKAKSSEDNSWSFSIDEVNLKKTAVHYQNATQRIDAELDDLNVDIKALDLNGQKLDVSILRLVKARIEVESLATSQSDKPFALPQLGWDISLDDLEIEQSSFILISDAPISVNDVSVNISDVKFADNQLEFDVEQIKGVIPNQIAIENISGEMSLIGDNLDIANLAIETDKDNVRADALSFNLNTERLTSENLKANISSATLHQLRPYIPKGVKLLNKTDANFAANTLLFTSDKLVTEGIVLSYGEALTLKSNLTLDNLKGNNLQVSGNVSKLKIDLAALDRMLNSFTIPDSLSQFRLLEMSGALEGSLEQLDVSRLDIKLDDVFATSISGRINHLGDLERLSLDARFNNLIVDIQQLPLPSNDNVALDRLGKIEFDGRVVGDLNSITIDGSFKSDLGDLVTDIALGNLTDIDNLTYKGDLSMHQFDLGTLLKNQDFNRITITTELDGKGIDFNNIDTKIKGRLSDVVFNGYDYADVNINAIISESKIDGQLSIDDQNIKLSYEGIISFLDGQSIYKFVAEIDTLNLKALGFYDKDVSISGLLKSDFKLPLRQGSDGFLDIYGLRISNPNESFYEDSLEVIAAKRSDSTFMDIRSDFMSFDIDGQYGIRDLPKAFMSFADHYINVDTALVAADQLSRSARIKGQLKTLLPLDVIIVDKLVQARNIGFDMDFNFVEYQGKGSMVADSLYYDKYFSERLSIDMLAKSKVITVNVLGKNNVASGIEIPIFTLENELNDRKLYSTVLAKDDDSAPKFKLSTVIENTDQALLISLKDSLVLNQKDWLANTGNLIKISDGKIDVNELTITDQNEYLKIYSTDDQGNDLAIDFKNFNVGQFTALLTSEPSKLSGNVNGKVEIRDITSDMYYLINADIEDIVYDSTSVGVLTIKASDNPKTNIVTADIGLKGPRNDLTGKGTYNTSSRAADFTLDIDDFQLMLLDPFLTEIMQDSKGALSGSMSLKGNIDQPLIDGAVTLDKAILLLL